MSRLHGLAAAICVAVTACGGGGGGSAGSAGGDSGGAGGVTPAPISATADKLFPLAANLRLVYDSTEGPEPSVVRADGTLPLSAGVSGTILRRQNFSTGADGARAYSVSESGVRQYAAPGADAIERAFDGSELMRWPVPAGHTYVQLDTTIDSGRDFDGDGRSDRVTMRSDITAVATESVVTPAGSFSNALHHRQVVKQTVLPSGGGAPVALETTTDTWYAPDIGPVKTTVTQSGSGATVTVTEALSRFRVGSRGKDNGTPAVSAEAPFGLAGPAAQISARFTEVVEPASLTAGAFTLVSDTGVLVAGTPRAEGRTVRFAPAQPLAAGYYTATLGVAVQDVFGNRITAARSWSFIVDAAAPGVVSNWPLTDAINVGLRELIGVTFSEAPSFASVNAANVRLKANGAVVPTTLQTSATGISMTPVGGLQRGTHYEVEISGVTDAAGNAMVGEHRFGFDTTPGRFGAQERLYPVEGVPGAFADAVGDINGDGLPDVLFTVSTSNLTNGYQYSLFVRKGRIDGTLGAPERLDVGPMDRLCDLNALAIGDLNGDGRPDVIVGSLICGVLVLNQTASGTLAPGQYIDTPVDVLRLADFDGDGRLDVAGAGRNATVAHLWKQTPSGQLVLMGTLDLGGEVARDLEIGDLDGDGRPDVVVALRVTSREPHIAVFRQQADGRFAPPQILSTGSVWGATGLALGDVNHDGKLDIVVTTGGNAPTWFAVLLQAFDGSFGAVTRVPTLDGPWAVRVADIDRDGRADIVVSHRGHYRVGIYLQRSDGSLAPEELYDAPYGTEPLQTLAIADLDGDGLLDLVISGEVIRQVPLSGNGGLQAEVNRIQRIRTAR